MNQIAPVQNVGLSINSSHAPDLIDSSDLYRKGDRDGLPPFIVDKIDIIFEKSIEKLDSLSYDMDGRHFDNPEASRKQIQKVIDAVRNGEEIKPVVIDTKGYVIDGQHRMSAFDYLGIEDIPVYKSFSVDTSFDNLKTRRSRLGIADPEPFFQEELSPELDGKLEVVYRGESAASGTGNFFSPSKDFAREFTQSGQDNEIIVATIKSSDIFESKAFAGSENQMTDAINTAISLGKGAVRLDEGVGQPSSVFVINKAVLNPHIEDKSKSDKEMLVDLLNLLDDSSVNQFRSDLAGAILKADAESYKQKSGLGLYQITPFDEGVRGVDVLLMGKEFQIDKLEVIDVNKNLKVGTQNKENNRGLEL